CFQREWKGTTHVIRKRSFALRAEEVFRLVIGTMTDIFRGQDPAMKPTAVVIDLPKTNSRLFAHSRWDAVSVLAAVFHCAYFLGMFCLFPGVPLWLMLIFGFVYSVSIHGTSTASRHNFIHNPYFRSSLLNRLFTVLESITIGFGFLTAITPNSFLAEGALDTNAQIPRSNRRTPTRCWSASD